VIYMGGPLNFNPEQPNRPSFDLSQFVQPSGSQPVFTIRTFGSEFGNLRRDASKNLDLSASKDFPFGERRYVQLRIETFNITNHVTFAAPNLSPTSSAFGTIASQANSPRYIQLGARVVW